MRIALGVEYDGYGFAGWQAQPGSVTVQGKLADALAQILTHPVVLYCAGRTDAGVHATGQVVHFDTVISRPLAAYTRGCNANLPAAIVVRWAQIVPDNFHARFSALARTYHYLICNQPLRSAVLSGRATWHQAPLNVTLMQEAAQALLGEQDFTSLRSAQCESRTPMRNIHQVSVTRHADIVVIQLTANAFLHHMVRNIAGVLLRVGAGRCPPQQLREILAAKDRRQAFETAPATGLYLSHVTYPDHFALPGAKNLPLFFW